jgi:hypothetical protein
MPNDITGISNTAWVSVTLTQNERWQVVLGQARLSLDTTPALGSMPLESGILLKNLMTQDYANGDVVRYRRVGTAPCTIARSRR